MGRHEDVVARLVREVPAWPAVLVLLGPPGAGKSMLAAALTQHLGDDEAVLSYAAHRAQLVGDPADMTADQPAGELLRARLAERCSTGRSTVVDGTHHLERSRAAVLAIAADAGVPTAAVVLTTPVEVCVARQRDRPPPRPGAQWGLRIPDPQVRALAAAIQAAVPTLVDEGFTTVVELDPHDTQTGRADDEQPDTVRGSPR